MDGLKLVNPQFKPVILWNSRGRAIKVNKPEEIRRLLQHGFHKAEGGVKAGDYNQLYDLGSEESVIPDQTHFSQDDEYIDVVKV